MSKDHGSVAPKERINIKYIPATGDQQAEVELPLKLLITGDFKGHGEESALEDRQPVRIDKDNFNDVLTKAEVTLEMAVPCVLTNDIENDLSINLQFKSINDFGPDAIARQVPEMNKLLELRNALVALKGPLGNTPAFRKQLQSLLADDASRQRLIRELNLTLPAPKDSPDA
ncbi:MULTISPECIES: type VI secretion system contractile sheath small subunit [unclassified Pseudomonas]|uniref:type VI secretion system contractile sheath small subunit n=1 Tax=unclassified Pseudomonas TaxID=196821 RepID=UPI001297DC64|nr:MULTISPECIES: type VI secretion system contractile sheath small subunit [unclassified Pseudomonas]MQT43807.1 type VI secretion system contractile sheath small subunit [Pseudomonas sp. FSL R10-0765]MQT53210.1 type VI secretion system contractile sheath small subunit [Pseudomonas sp. FSL R10-2398]MQU03405.1 type VI secretion system contractile sheath small subunit [Pseudomonas sp. FSL R10-2245]MQU14020.1 type VI secretion system contractile sheath small subunit [Pseudomonas sp. FSL R10-2189]M